MSLKSDRLERPCCEIQETLWLMSPSPLGPHTSSGYIVVTNETALQHMAQNLHVHLYGLHRGKHNTRDCEYSQPSRLPHVTSTGPTATA